MIYAITGHTSGIGKGLIERTGGIGISRSTGFDITNPGHYSRIRDAAAECDVFVNNACAEFGQTQLLVYLFDQWQHTNKTIINVGSRIADFVEPITPDKNHLLDYWTHKRSLKDTSEFLSTCPGRLRILYRSFGYVGTEAILQRHPELTDYLTVDQSVDLILSGVVER